MSRTFYAPLKRTLVPAQASGSATATFTRATTATVIDHEGVVRPVLSGEARFYGARRVYNTLNTTSEDFSVAQWTTIAGGTGVAPTKTPDFALAPDGTMTACRVQLNKGAGVTNGDYSLFRNSPAGLAAGSTRQNSIWIKSTDGASTYDVTLSYNDAASGVIAVSGTWQRMAIVATTGSPAFDMGLRGDVTANATADVLVWRPQLEVVEGQSNQAPAEYVSVGVLSTPYHGANVDGVKYFATTNGNSVNANVVTEAAGVAIADATLRGYLSESATTNRCLQSEVFDNASWAKSNVTVSANSTTAPDGTTTADTLTASAGNGTVIQDLGVVASAAKNGSVWLKRLTGTGNIDLTLDNGSTWTTAAVTSSWTRFSVTQTLANEDFGIRIVTSGDAVYAWGGQVETGADGVTSYVPTTTIAVTRNDDALTYPTAGNFNTSSGTVYCEGVQLTLGTAGGSTFICDSSGIALPIYTQANGTLTSYDGTGAAAQAGQLVLGTRYRMACTFSAATGLNVYQDGTAGTNPAFDGTMNATSVAIALGAGTRTVRNVKIWSEVLPINATGNPIETDDPMVLTTTAITPSDSGSIDYDGFITGKDGLIRINDDAGNTCTLKVEGGRVHSIRIKRVWATGTDVTGIVGVTF